MAVAVVERWRAVVERFKQELMYGLTKKSGRCGEVRLQFITFLTACLVPIVFEYFFLPIKVNLNVVLCTFLVN